MDCGEQCAIICGPQLMQLWGANFGGIPLMVCQLAVKLKCMIIRVYTPLHPCFCGNRWVLFSIY